MITGLWGDALRLGKDYAAHIFIAGLALTLLELFFGRSRFLWRNRFVGALNWLAYILITAPALILLRRLWNQVGVAPLFHLDLMPLSSSENDLLAVAGALLAWWLVNQLAEFFYYWFHRAQHMVAFLWRFHAVHHAIRDMTAFNSNHHPTEEIFRFPLIAVPLSLLVDVSQGPLPWILSALIASQGLYEHSATKLSLGHLRLLIPDNRYHRIHHSRTPAHWGKNFGSGSLLWDWVFGTMHYPRPGEWPEVGLDDMPAPANLREFLLAANFPSNGKKA